ncbi:type I-E CRISPR-associated protein Cse2/CasB [Nocardia rhizosphaerihabitans]|uniref:CRISPR system Cascade subunit CasB n=1 Tax=Nocardia rhizosphaerihabitans TaxID=1691570 RepID=A0ABQ2K473_9NOCA|nr:type I-E CRISPR-associated protein Cse2/CasB [Nocardia rhizosphaerihabitans]GGN66278.1 hypothetical protein GCM10011610_01090 [Nocardia rhizosphaerihabitans]
MTAPPGNIKFVEYITDLTDDLGVRAALRSGLGRPVERADRMHAYLSPWTTSSKPHEEAVRYTVASLIAHRPVGAIPGKAPGNIGASIARYTAVAANTRESSVHLLSRQPAGALCRMLTRIVVPMRSDDVAIDFATLLQDATRWPRYRNDTARRWLQAFYRAQNLDQDAETSIAAE